MSNMRNLPVYVTPIGAHTYRRGQPAEVTSLVHHKPHAGEFYICYRLRFISDDEIDWVPCAEIHSGLYKIHTHEEIPE